MYDFGAGRAGERRGDWTPSEWLAAILIVMTILMGLAMSLGLCYYVTKRQARRSTPGSVIGGRSIDSKQIREQFAHQFVPQTDSDDRIYI